MKKSTKLLIVLTVVLTVTIALIIFSAVRLAPEWKREVAAEAKRAEEERIEYSKTELCRVAQTPEDFTELERYENLTSLDLSGSECYEEIMNYISAHPEVHVTYSVRVPSSEGELIINNEEVQVSLSQPEQVPALVEKALFLPNLGAITIEKPGFSAEELKMLSDAFPKSRITFSICPDIAEVSPDAGELDLTELTPEYLQNAAGFLEIMPNLTLVFLTAEDGTNQLSLSEAGMLLNARPEAEFDYRFESFGVPVSMMDESIEYYGNNTGLVYDEGLAEIEAMLPYMPALKSLYFEYCEIDYDLLADFRDRHPELNTVWRINFGPYSCRTDREMVFANGSLTTAMCDNLKYCTKVKYIDLGHNDGITSVEFVRNMPELEVAIFAVGGLQDVSPLAECPKLRYLEIFLTDVTDVSPLAACTELEHINFSYTQIRDITPLFGLTKMKRMWDAGGWNVPASDREKIQELLPDCVFHFGGGESTGNHWRFNADGSRVEPYEEISQIFGYDNWRETITFW